MKKTQKLVIHRLLSFIEVNDMTLSDFVRDLQDQYLNDYQVVPICFTTESSIKKSSYRVWAVNEIIRYVLETVTSEDCGSNYILKKVSEFKRMVTKFSVMGHGGDAYHIFLTAAEVADEICVYLSDL